jgi:hypothetical protein
MICPSCGKKTIFDRSRCPACGCDPWTKPGETLAAGAGMALPETSSPGRASRALRVFRERPRLSLVFVLLGTLQMLIAGGLYVASGVASPAHAGWFFEWLWGLAMTVMPGLLLLAVGEGLAYLAAIRDLLERKA